MLTCLSDVGAEAMLTVPHDDLGTATCLSLLTNPRGHLDVDHTDAASQDHGDALEFGDVDVGSALNRMYFQTTVGDSA